jgi:sarcosine oxidase
MGQRVYDSIVVGVGGMGAAAIYALARRGRRVLGLEQFAIPHELGSSAGSTRIFRFAYFEHPSYVPLMHLSVARWQALQHDFGERLLTSTGGLDIGPASGRVVTGAREACQRHRLRHEVLQAREVSRRFPAWRLPQEFAAVHQPDAGFLRAERAILAHVSLARRLGADVHEQEAVRGFRATGERVEVTTQAGIYEAGSLVLTAGAWTAKLVQGFSELAIPERQVVTWFDANGPQFATHAFPVFILECPQRGIFYGFPRLADEGVKIGKFHHRRERVDPDAVDRRIAAEDIMVVGEVETYLSAPLGPPRSCKTCMFVNSPDQHFIVDVLPGHHNVVVAAGFSGHGYKFCSGLGEILADLATRGATEHDTDLFRLARPAVASARTS